MTQRLFSAGTKTNHPAPTIILMHVLALGNKYSKDCVYLSGLDHKLQEGSNSAFLSMESLVPDTTAQLILSKFVRCMTKGLMRRQCSGFMVHTHCWPWSSCEDFHSVHLSLALLQ